MLRRTAWLFPILFASACGGASPPAPAARSQPAAPAPAVTPPPPLAPAPASTSDPACAAALPYFNAIRSTIAQPTPDLAALRGAYVGTAVQTLVKTSDADTGRNDDAALTTALAADAPGAFITAEFLLHGALSQRLRHNLELASKDKDPAKRAAAWSAARCAWEQHLRHLGADLSPETGSAEDIKDIKDAVADIDAVFTAGAAALAAQPIDERVLRPGHETIEKSWFRIIHRALAAAAARARKDGDALAARRALGLFQLLRDRLQDRNTPGIARVEAQLGGDPKQLDPAAVMREIDIALVKRARKYASHALDAHLTGVDGLTSVTEGLAYTRILLPGMRAAIRDPGFDPEAHVAAWQQFADSVEAAEPEPDELKKLSADLVHWNCAYQQTLGIRECTATADEHAKP
jgi:hypothetical protein